MFGMFTTVIRNVFSKPATRLYPFEKREPFDEVRGHLEISREDCTLCGICALKCPAQCIEVDQKEGRWKLNPFQCVMCGVCIVECPWDCLSADKTYFAPGTKEYVEVTPPEPDYLETLAG